MSNFKLRPYLEDIYHDLLHVDVTHIFLGNLLMYYCHMEKFGLSNTYEFSHDGSILETSSTNN